jgi:hypothetical protein
MIRGTQAGALGVAVNVTGVPGAEPKVFVGQSAMHR